MGADFLGDWQGGGYDSDYTKGRVPHGHHGKAEMSHHIQFEANMSLAGANADHRVPVGAAMQKNVLAHLYAELTNTPVSGQLPANVATAVSKAVARLRAAGDAALVVTGLEDVAAQELVLAINATLKSTAFMPQQPKFTRHGNTAEVNKAIDDIIAGTVNGLITFGVNPVYSHAKGAALAAALPKLGLSVAFAMKEDETASLAKFVAATPHYLESWGDYEFTAGEYVLAQPTIRPLFDTKQFQDVLLQLTGSTASYYETIKSNWAATVLDGASGVKPFTTVIFLKLPPLQCRQILLLLQLTPTRLPMLRPKGWSWSFTPKLEWVTDVSQQPLVTGIS